MRTITSGYRDEKNKLNGAAVIRLFKVYSTPPMYLSEYDKDVTFDSQSYTAIPMQSSDVSENVNGTIDSMSITIGNANRDMIAIIQAQDLLDIQVDVIEVFENLLNDPNSYVKDVYYITSILASNPQESVTFTLDSLLMRTNIQIPKMTYAKGTCQWKYKSEQCGFETGYSNVVFTTNADVISWGATTIGATSINAGNVAYTTNNPVYIYYIEGNSTLATCLEEKIPELCRGSVPKKVILCKYFGGTQYMRFWSSSMDLSGYPNSTNASCDFTYKGPNGCFAHKNGMRPGVFPGVGSGGRNYL